MEGCQNRQTPTRAGDHAVTILLHLERFCFRDPQKAQPRAFDASILNRCRGLGYRQNEEPKIKKTE